MITEAVTLNLISRSVIAVPPLARRKDYSIDIDANRKIVDWMEAGGVTSFLYGGNAMMYHSRPSEFETILSMLIEIASDQSWMIPSVGPSYGTMMDQCEVLKDYEFPSAMILPQKDVADQQGIARGLKTFVDRFEKPIVLYLKHDRILDASLVSKMVNDGLISWIKYAVVRDDPSNDDYLRQLVDTVSPSFFVSGIGEQPAIVHFREFGVCGYTSGCVCVEPSMTATMLKYLQQADYEKAERIRASYGELEDLRNTYGPISVLHRAVELAGIAPTGPMLPLLSDVDESVATKILSAVERLKTAANSV